ncbi:MAG TPA: ferrochelatase [Crenotrichaceae bacterium]|nr:ferrochelatase [Crenotrichaceae bacterium]
MTEITNNNPTHDKDSSVGVLITNLGTPDAPTPKAVRRYLKQFLWDPRIVDIPRIPWWLILHGIILRTRPRRSAELYKSVWTDEGSPLLVISRAQKDALQKRLGDTAKVELGMRYGNPSIPSALEKLRQHGVKRIIVLPLYPQYSCTTAASTFDEIANTFKTWRNLPHLQFISRYYTHTKYINALCSSIQEHWAKHGQAEKLILSFHGCPKHHHTQGDPYFDECMETAQNVAQQLGLSERQWLATFQSRFGRTEWLKPYTDETLKELAQNGTKSIDIICPGFSADCLETLEEVAVENRSYFIKSGGKKYHYIPALNSRPDFIEAAASLVLSQI